MHAYESVFVVYVDICVDTTFCMLLYTMIVFLDFPVLVWMIQSFWPRSAAFWAYSSGVVRFLIFQSCQPSSAAFCELVFSGMYSDSCLNAPVVLTNDQVLFAQTTSHQRILWSIAHQFGNIFH